MKCIQFTLLFICLAVLSAFSQTELPETGLGKGVWTIGGSGWFKEHAAFNNIEYAINTKAGYLLTEKLTVGLNGYYYFNGVVNGQSGTVGPFARYYFVNKRVAPFAEAEYSFGWMKTQLEFSPDYETSRIDVYGAGAGLDFFITKNVALESTVKYMRYDGDRDKRFSINLGFQIFLNRKK